MDFAKILMEKYGWSEGQGLGKDNDGITKAIKPTLKFDTAGLGHDKAETFTDHWWVNMYDNASNNVNPNTGAIKKRVGSLFPAIQSTMVLEPLENSSNSNNQKNSGKRNAYAASFMKASTLSQGTEVDISDLQIDDSNKKSKTKSKSQAAEIKMPTDDELLMMCSGRTAHKGARHGINQSGKLQRISDQDNVLLKALLSRFPEICKKPVTEGISERNVKICNGKFKKHDKKYNSLVQDKKFNEGIQISSALLNLHNDSKTIKKSKKKKRKSRKNDDHEELMDDSSSENEDKSQLNLNNVDYKKPSSKKQHKSRKKCDSFLSDALGSKLSLNAKKEEKKGLLGLTRKEYFKQLVKGKNFSKGTKNFFKCLADENCLEEIERFNQIAGAAMMKKYEAGSSTTGAIQINGPKSIIKQSKLKKIVSMKPSKLSNVSP